MSDNLTPTQDDIASLIYHERISSDSVYVMDDVFAVLKETKLVCVDMIVDGQGLHRIRDQHVPCKAGDIFVVPPEVSHGYFVEKEGECLQIRRISLDASKWLNVSLPSDNEGYCYGLFRENKVVACAILNAVNREKISILYDDIEREISQQDNQWQSIVKGYLSILFVTLSRYIDCAIKDVKFASARDWSTVLSTIKIVHSNYSDSALTLESIATRLYISKAHLSELFHKITGKKFSKYLRDFRLAKACEELAKTDKTIEEVVYDCGLKDIPSFYKNFNVYTGMTPSEYRRANQTIDYESVEYKKLLQITLKYL